MNEETDPAKSANAQGNAWSLESAESHLCAGAPADAERAEGTDGESAQQARILREWAAQTGCLISPEHLHGLQPVSNRTSEHKVYFDPDSGRAIKQTLPGEFGWVPVLANGRWTLGIAKPLDYLRRWIIFNEIFGDDIRLEGIGIFGPSMVIGSKVEPVSILISQPWRLALDINNPLPSENEVAECLRAERFLPLGKSFYGWQRLSDGVVLLDARPDNFIKTKDGIAPIDLPMTRVG